MAQPERKASSTRRTPSTPTKPDSVGRPPRKARRNSFSQRLSRLVIAAGAAEVRAARAALLGGAIAEGAEQISQRTGSFRRQGRLPGLSLARQAAPAPPIVST